MKIKITVFLLFFLITSCALREDAIKKAPTSSNISILDYVSSEGYANGCAQANLNLQLSQISYREVYPGVTTLQNVKGKIGEPSHIIKDGREINLFYDKSPSEIASIIIVDDVVDRIDVDNYNSSLSLKKVVEMYGCPNLIYATDRSENATGKYNAVTFSYPELGFELWLEGTRVTLENIPNELRYFVPMSLKDYIDLHSDILYFKSPISIPVRWSEVVID